MREEKRFHGVIVPMVTPFTAQGKIDEEAAIRILDLILSAGAFPFLLGTTGESASISMDTRIQFVKIVTRHVQQRTTIYAGISDNCLENTLTLAEKFFDLGIRVFVVHLPSYYPLTQEMMLQYYQTVAEQCPGEMLLYNITSTTHMSLPLQVIETLSHHDKIVGLKDSQRDLQRLSNLATQFSHRQDFSLFCGWTSQSANMLSLGFDGIVPSTANIIPKKFSELYHALQHGDQATAQRLQAEIDPITDLHQKDLLGSQAIAGLKAMMSELGLCGPHVLPPLTRLSPKQEQQIRKKIRELL